MAPLIQDDTDCFSVSSLDDENVFDQKRADTTYYTTYTDTAPLHEQRTRRVSFADEQPQQTVSFDATDIEYDVIGLHEYTPKELEASWFTEDDMHTMQQNARSDARLFERGLRFEFEFEFAVRGLEGRTTKGIRNKRRRRKDAYDAVFEEIDVQHKQQQQQQQQQQHTNGGGNRCSSFDEELVADAYFEVSEPCAILAQILGNRAAIEAAMEYDR